jgi:ribosomal-protein-alanine N-acetyltransferase
MEEALAHMQLSTQKSNPKKESTGTTLKGDTTLIGVAGFYKINPENFRAEIGYIIQPIAAKIHFRSCQNSLTTDLTA